MAAWPRAKLLCPHCPPAAAPVLGGESTCPGQRALKRRSLTPAVHIQCVRAAGGTWGSWYIGMRSQNAFTHRHPGEPPKSELARERTFFKFKRKKGHKSEGL